MVRFGIVGYGRIGRRHATAIAECEEGQLVAVCDADPESHPADVEGFTDLEAMLAASDLDVLCVCSPNGLHAPHALTALEQGVSVVVEKPMALHYDDALRMLKAAKEGERQLFCMLQNRYSPQVRWLKEIVEQRALGDILQVQVNCFWNRDRRYYQNPDGTNHAWHGRNNVDGGPLFTQFSHFIDLMIWLFGEFPVSNATFANFIHGETIEFEDAGKFDFELAGGGFGVFHYSTAVWDTNQESSITIIGSKGSISVGGQYMNRLDYCHFEGLEGDVHFAPGPETGQAGNHELVIRNAIDVIQGKTIPDFDISDAVLGVKIIEEVYRNRKL